MAGDEREIAVVLVHGILNHVVLHLFQRGCLFQRRFFFAGEVEVGAVEGFAFGNNHGLFDGMFQFADITEPGLLLQFILCIRAEAHGGFTVDIAIFCQEYFSQRNNVFRTFAEGRYFYMYCVDTIQKVLTELLFLYHLLQIAVGGTDQADIYRDRGVASYPDDAAALDSRQ